MNFVSNELISCWLMNTERRAKIPKKKNLEVHRDRRSGISRNKRTTDEVKKKAWKKNSVKNDLIFTNAIFKNDEILSKDKKFTRKAVKLLWRINAPSQKSAWTKKYWLRRRFQKTFRKRNFRRIKRDDHHPLRWPLKRSRSRQILLRSFHFTALHVFYSQWNSRLFNFLQIHRTYFHFTKYYHRKFIENNENLLQNIKKAQ